MQELLLNLNSVELCLQTFGDQHNPAVLLIYGAAGQGILWNIDLCKNIAKEGYFVIRYDNRDTGKSSAINYELSPYNLDDMAKDVIAILDYFKKDKAHIVGSSMGGYIAQILAILYPERLLSLTLIMTTVNSLPLRGIRGLCNLPGPNAEIIRKISEIFQAPRTSLEERIKNLVKTWKLFNGDYAHFPEEEWLELAKESYHRAKSKNAVKNHRLAVLNSKANRTNELQNLKIPSLIIHGNKDQIIPFAHAEYAKNIINSATLLEIDKMGHLLTSIFTTQVEDNLLLHFANSYKS